MGSKLRFAIFASGSGTNAESLIKNFPANGEVALVLTDKTNAGVIDRAKKLSVPVEVVPFSQSKGKHESLMIEMLKSYKIDWILLAGYMRILSENFLKQWIDTKLGLSRIVNIHPSLLPLFPGRDGYGDAFKAQVDESGVTIHFVDAGMDTGPIIMQKRFKREKEDTLEIFKARGLALEHQLYPQVVQLIVENKIKSEIINNKTVVRVDL